MNGYSNGNVVQYYVISIALIMVIFIGAIVTISPIFILFLFLFLFASLFLFAQPFKFSFLIVVLTGISVDGIIKVSLFGFDFGSLYKLLTIILVISIIMKNKNNLNNKFLVPFAIVLSIILIQTIFLFLFQREIPLFRSMITFLGIASPLSLLLINWPKNYVNKILILITTLPIISVFIGVLFELLGLGNALRYEYTGTIRLSGTNPPAQLAELCFYSIFISIYMFNKYKKYTYIILTFVNTVILFATLTRAAIICSFVLLIYLFYQIIKRFINGKWYYFFILGVALLSLTFIIFTFADSIIQRFSSGFNETGINSSGREEAWGFYLSFAENNEVFGKGLGATTHIYNENIARTGSFLKHFLAPHNEYVRFFLELGYFGISILLLFLVFLFIKTGNLIENTNRLFLYLFGVSFFILTYFDNTLTSIHSVYPLMYIFSLLNSNRSYSSDGNGK
ncbi:hypothetical protein GJU41_09765 [Bacillus idriensis]|uniref:O-antigen ligase-related domain-containing protein n=1 Tax=Metabacillus idriensis TaxID=324768 RepID=A0A6I2M8V0_9BACI|nr:O-antigen ligase family protein [Metabacillus idriensis]MRX54259.1 hypothetical protein [Metabacillus idriensis]